MINFLFGWVSRRLADHIRRQIEAMPLPTIVHATIRSVFDDEILDEQRRETAMAFLDDNLLGYALIAVRDRDGQAVLEPEFALSDEMWPAVRHTLSQLIIAGEIYE